jgi:hypothetical protein
VRQASGRWAALGAGNSAAASELNGAAASELPMSGLSARWLVLGSGFSPRHVLFCRVWCSTAAAPFDGEEQVR